MTAQIYSMEQGKKMAYQFGNSRAINNGARGWHYETRKNQSSPWNQVPYGSGIKKLVAKVKAAVA